MALVPDIKVEVELLDTKVGRELLERIRANLNKWQARYASPANNSARKDQREARLLIQEIDEILLRL